MRDFSSFDTMLLYLKLQTCFVLPGVISAIRSLKTKQTHVETSARTNTRINKRT